MKLAKAANGIFRLNSIPNSIDYSFYGHLIQRCADGRRVRQGKQLHARLILSSTVLDNFLASKLITFYSKIQQLREAHHVFDEIPVKNTFSWNALLIGYSVNNFYSETLQLFSAFMNANPCWDHPSAKPDNFTVTCVLKALSGTGVVSNEDSGFGKVIHCYVVKNGFDSDVFVSNGLITYYSRCDDLVSARRMFDVMPERDLVSWNSMISGYSQSGFYEECKKLYREMLDLVEFRPNEVTVVSILQACAYSSDLILGLEVHKYVIQNHITMDLSICNSIVALYAKCGSLDFARELFEEMSEKDDITYSALISGHMLHGFVDEAMNLFKRMKNPGLSVWNAVVSGQVQNNQKEGALHLIQEMQILGLKPNSITISSIFPVVSSFSNLNAAKEIHGYTIRNDYDRYVYVATAIIDAYGKMGFMHGAELVFHKAKKVTSVIIWTAMISAYAGHGYSNRALCSFNEMVKNGIKPDSVTFTAVLSACAHTGMVTEAWEIFQSLVPKYGIEPLAEHYACMVGVLTRAGNISEAVKFVNEMPIEPTAKIWGALLDGASCSSDLELGKFICNHLFEMEPESTGNYMVMANLYSKAGRWEEAEDVRGKMDEIGLKKIAGSSWIQNPIDEQVS